jgi:hypothetical protein
VRVEGAKKCTAQNIFEKPIACFISSFILLVTRHFTASGLKIYIRIKLLAINYMW